MGDPIERYLLGKQVYSGKYKEIQHSKLLSSSIRNCFRVTSIKITTSIHIYSLTTGLRKVAI